MTMDDPTARKIEEPQIPQPDLPTIEEGLDLSFIISRAKEVLLNPKTVWDTIATEKTTVKGLYMRYILVMAAIPVVCEFIRMITFGQSIPFIGTMKWSIGGGLVTTIVTYALQLISVFIIGMVIHKLAPKFQGQLSQEQGLQLIAFSMTPGFVAGFFRLIPGLTIVGFVLGIYGLYIFFQGIPKMTGVPESKKYSFGITSMIISIVLLFIVNVMGQSMAPGGLATSLNTDSGSIEKLELPGGVSVDMNKFQKTLKQFEKMVPQDK